MSSIMSLANSYLTAEVNGRTKRYFSYGERGNSNQDASVPPIIRIDFSLCYVICAPYGPYIDDAQRMVHDISSCSVYILADESLEALHVNWHVGVGALTHMAVPESEHSPILSSVAAVASAMIASATHRPSPMMRLVHTSVSAMSISVRVLHIFQYNGSYGMQTGIVANLSRSANLLPASKSSINMLERGRHYDFEETTCTICLDEIAHDLEFVRMPCKHVFHADCIEKWLSVSHLCPACRYQMPVDV